MMTVASARVSGNPLPNEESPRRNRRPLRNILCLLSSYLRYGYIYSVIDRTSVDEDGDFLRRFHIYEEDRPLLTSVRWRTGDGSRHFRSIVPIERYRRAKPTGTD
jgi:hypothetical protein